MAEFHNIFTTRKTIIQEPKKELPKIKIHVDYREKNCLVPANLIKLGLNVEFKELKIADYLVNNIAIERKTVDDFLASMKNQHLRNQLEELKQYENKLLIIEGLEHQELYSDTEYAQHKFKGMNPNSVRGFLLSITLKHKIPIIFSKHQKDTAKFICVLANKKEKESSLNVTKKSLTKKEQIQFILEGFPGIGPKASKKLLNHFKSIKEIISASQEELQKIIGKKAEIFNLTNIKY